MNQTGEKEEKALDSGSQQVIFLPFTVSEEEEPDVRIDIDHTTEI